jgi:hypothetical protein
VEPGSYVAPESVVSDRAVVRGRARFLIRVGKPRYTSRLFACPLDIFWDKASAHCQSICANVPWPLSAVPLLRTGPDIAASEDDSELGNSESYRGRGPIKHIVRLHHRRVSARLSHVL